jgi:1,6-anhydro-N-acetylmuramate kinase
MAEGCLRHYYGDEMLPTAMADTYTSPARLREELDRLAEAGATDVVLHPCSAAPDQLTRMADVDPVLSALGFAPGQAGVAGGHGQVIFCRGFVDGTDGSCIDLVIDLEAVPDWRITDVRYWGSPATAGTCRSIPTPTSRRS